MENFFCDRDPRVRFRDNDRITLSSGLSFYRALRPVPKITMLSLKIVDRYEQIRDDDRGFVIDCAKLDPRDARCILRCMPNLPLKESSRMTFDVAYVQHQIERQIGGIGKKQMTGKSNW
jgi:hypothetical protein